MEPETLGQYLARERRMREIDLEEITAVTRIKRRYLEALERDEFEDLPPKPFVVGFLKAYAKYVGLDPDDLVSRYLYQISTDKNMESAFDDKDSGSDGFGMFFRRILRHMRLF